MTDCNRDIDCRTAVQKLWDYLDQELTPERMDDVRRHLDRCGSCLPHHDYGRAFLAALAAAQCVGRAMDNLRAAGFSA